MGLCAFNSLFVAGNCNPSPKPLPMGWGGGTGVRPGRARNLSPLPPLHPPLAVIATEDGSDGEGGPLH